MEEYLVLEFAIDWICGGERREKLRFLVWEAVRMIVNFINIKVLTLIEKHHA